MLLSLPSWVYIVILLIFLSGYMAFRAMRAEQIIENQFIEREGKIYMDRMMAEKEDKQIYVQKKNIEQSH